MGMAEAKVQVGWAGEDRVRVGRWMAEWVVVVVVESKLRREVHSWARGIRRTILRLDQSRPQRSGGKGPLLTTWARPCRANGQSVGVCRTHGLGG